MSYPHCGHFLPPKKVFDNHIFIIITNVLWKNSLAAVALLGTFVVAISAIYSIAFAPGKFPSSSKE